MPRDDRQVFILNLTQEEAQAFHLAINSAESILQGAIHAGTINGHPDIVNNAKARLGNIEKLWLQFEQRYHSLDWCDDPNCVHKAKT